jgi:hypothetical protein
MRFTTARGGLAPALMGALMAAVAATPSPAQAADQAREVVGLFVQSCLKHVGESRDLQEWIAATPQLRKFAPEAAQSFLEGKKGEVWSAENKAGLFALVLFADDSCTVLAQQASADQVSLVFAEYVRRKGLPLNKVGDKKEFVRGIDERKETWRSHGDGKRYEVVLVTSKSQRADAQAVLTILPDR